MRCPAVNVIGSPGRFGDRAPYSERTYPVRLASSRCSMHEAERLRQRSLDGNLEQVRGLRVDRDGAVRPEECRDLILSTAAHSAERRVRVHWKKEERMRVRRHAWVLCESEVV